MKTLKKGDKAPNFSGLDQNSEYEFQVVAIGPDGYISQPSNTVNASTWADVSNGMEGNGSTGNPYQVTTCQELQDITMHLQSGVQYILANDIDCSDSITWNNGTGFEPIGMHGEPFNGTLSGNGHAITNLYIDQTANVFNNEIVTGLFGVAGGSARLLNFKLANATIIGAQTTGETTGSTGGIIGKIDSSSGGSPVVSRVSFDGSITLPGCNGYHYVGGIVGRMTGDLNLDSTSSTGDIVVNDNGDCYEYNYAVGGLAGAIEGTDIDNTTVSNSYSTMNITVSGEATSYCGILCRDIGGLIGLANNVSVQKSYAAGDIDVIGDTGSFAQYIIAGGLIGEQNSNISLIDNFAATPIDVPVQATWVGAMVGFDHNYAISGGSWSNDLFDYTVLGLGTDAPCVGSTPGATRCSGVNSNGSQNNYFTNNHANEPMASWNFNTLWETTSGYPRHRTDANITAAAPTGVTTSIASTTAITISWDATSDPSDTYNLNYRKTGASSWTSHAAGTVANSISVSGLDEATSYDFQVIRFDKFGYHSDAVIVTASTARPNYTLISSCQDLQNMNNNLTENYELAHDIDCSDTVNWDGGQGFKPVGTFEPFTGNVNPFSGVLAGNTHTISNLYCNRPGEATCGLFSMTTDAVIQDLTLQSPVIDDAILSAGSLVGVVLNSTITNVHSKDVTINGNPAIAGGLIGAAATGGNPQTDFVTITKSSVTGSITTPAGGTANIGGFIGGISASVNIQDNYSNVAITTAAVSMGGGFTGMAQIQDSSIISRNYAAGSFMVTSSDPELNQASPLLQGFPTTYSLLGGFGGVYVDDDDDSATATITNNFDHVALSSVSPENMSTGFFVAATNPDVDFSTNAFDADQAGTTNCASSQVGLINCNAISGQPNYFKNNSSNSPLNEWDFVNIWKKTTEFPVFDEVVLTTPTTNVVPPVVSSAQQPCFTAIFGFGECPKPTVKPVAPTVEQAVATAVKTESIVGATTRGSATTPADEVGVLGAIKNFVRSLPLVVVVGFPYLLFGLLFLAIIVLLLELLREMRRAHLLEALIKKQQLLAEERDAFWHLAANYLRAPVTLIAGGAEALRDMHAIDQTSSISILATSLQTKVGDIMKKIEGSVSLQSISKIPHGLKRGHVRRSVYLVPLAIIGLLVVLANYAASSYRNINPGTMGYLAQALIFVCVAVGLYWALSYLIQGKKRRKLAQDMYERQTTELASARHDLINDTATILASDTNKLDMLIKNLPATIASTAPGALATLREGTDRLREIVHSFEMLIKVQEADTVATSTVDLGTILSKARAKLTPQITSKNVRVMAPAAALSVSAESEMAQQVIDSIVSNAVDYSPTGGTVNVETRNLGDHVQVRITDQGQGISKDQLAHLFQPFVRADGKSAMDMSHGGFGINLYLDKLIMEKLGGTIEAASAPGKGTAITLTWPS